MNQPEYSVEVRRLLKDISAYIDFLTVQHGLRVSIHQLDKLVNSFMDNLMPWNSHVHPYCQCIKRDPKALNECQCRQVTLFGSIGEKPFFGTCWAGMGEYVFPIPNLYGSGRGFVSVSGYKGDPEKAKAQMLKISRKYDIPHAELRQTYSGLISEYPPIEELAVMIKPLVHMFALLLNYLHDTTTQFPEQHSSSGRLFTSICHMLKNNYSVHYSVEDLARMHNCSASHISHMFLKHGGCSYHTYVNNMRINAAKLLLTSTNMNIQQISDHLGYTNSNYFSTVFKRSVGMSPREYRRLYSTEEQCPGRS